MTPEEAGDIDTERRLEEWHEKKCEKKRRAPKSPAFLPLSKRPKSGKMKTFHVTFEVPEEYWNAMSNGLGFTEADLPGVFAENFCQLADQAPEGKPVETCREMRFVTLPPKREKEALTSLLF